VHLSLAMLATSVPVPAQAGAPSEPWTMYVVGDSLSHGTMDATNNHVHSLNGFVEKLAESLREVIPLRFVQPLYGFNEDRFSPFLIPTNFAVDGADVFSIDGLEYYKRVGATQSVPSSSYQANRRLPWLASDATDRVLYPINVLRGEATSQMSAAEWSLARNAASPAPRNEALLVWIGNNDTSLAVLGLGGENPSFVAIPYEESKQHLTPTLVAVMEIAKALGLVSFDAYTVPSIQRNMTDIIDFQAKAFETLSRLASAPSARGARREMFVLTLPYYPAAGYLFDSEDIEFYLQKLDPTYTVPPTFQRVAPPGEPIVNPLQGDRISLFTFGFMYMMLTTGSSVADVNIILEENGVQKDGLVLTEAEQQVITDRIDEFNEILRRIAFVLGDHVHVVEVGDFLNDALTGDDPILIGGVPATRKWVRGGAFSLDGVHPNYVGHTVVSNFVLERMNEVLGLNAPPHDINQVALGDPYLDRDGDGFAPGPNHPASGATELMYLFRDPDDTNPNVEPVMPPNVWVLISNALVIQILESPTIRAEAQRQGLLD
jgi:hypothetical protein